MAERPAIVLVVSIDVEEEGLFCDSYAQSGVTVENTASLSKLRPLLEAGVRPTFFCAHSVLADPRACERILALRKAYPLEIAAHLHYWNTPPFAEQDSLGTPLTRVPSKDLPLPLFSQKLATVIALAKNSLGTEVTSFRMGRWDIHAAHFPLLAQAGILTDASVRPLHGSHSLNLEAPDHFLAPSEPYWIGTSQGTLFEVPLTVTPLVNALRPLLTKAPSFLARATSYLQRTMMYWGALAMLPVYHPLAFMKLVARLALARNIPLLSLTWHSSEMHPAATPHIPSEAHVQALLTKVQNFVAWLTSYADVTFATVGESRTLLGAQAKLYRCKHGDWTVC